MQDSPRAAIWPAQTSRSQSRPGSNNSAGLESRGLRKFRPARIEGVWRRCARVCARIIDKEVESTRIRHRRAVGRPIGGRSHEDPPYGHFHLLPGERAGNGPNLVDPVRYVARRVFASQLLADLVLQSLIQNNAGHEL